MPVSLSLLLKKGSVDGGRARDGFSGVPGGFPRGSYGVPSNTSTRFLGLNRDGFSGVPRGFLGGS